MVNSTSQNRKIKRKNDKRKKQLREAQRRRRIKIKIDTVFNLKTKQRLKRAQYMRNYRARRQSSIGDVHKGKNRVRKRIANYKTMCKNDKITKILNRIMKKIHLTKAIEAGNRCLIECFPPIFSKTGKPYYLSIQEIIFVEDIIASKGTKFKLYNYSQVYAAWAGDDRYRNMTAQEIQTYLSKFKKHCKM